MRRRIRVLRWPVCSPDRSPIENIWRIIKRKVRQRRPETIEQLDAFAARLLLQLSTMTANEAIEIFRERRGAAAIQTVKVGTFHLLDPYSIPSHRDINYASF
uniref:Tc1-like transposase DDE domain-containing protein n=1 Tax=Nothobranchius furzeri TaxID=105023 RepID=A0A8C6NTK3_NOTFU